MDDPTQSDVVGTVGTDSTPEVVAVVAVVAMVVGMSVRVVGFWVDVGGSTIVVPLPLLDVVSPPVGTGGTRRVVELVPDPVGNTVTPVPAVPEEMMLEIMLSRPVEDADGVAEEVLGANVVVAPVPVADPVGSSPPRIDDRIPPPSDELDGVRVWYSGSAVSVEDETPVPVPEYVTPAAVDVVGVEARTPLEPRIPLGPVMPSVADEGERIGSKTEERPKEMVGRTIIGGITDDGPEETVVATALDGEAWPRVVVTPLLTTTVLEMMTVLTTPDATASTDETVEAVEAVETVATGDVDSGVEPPVKTPRRSPRRSRLVEELEVSSTELDVVFEISRLTCRGK